MVMVRLQILLTEEQNTDIRVEALRRGVSISEVIRGRLETERLLAHPPTTGVRRGSLAALIGLAQSNEGEPTDVSVHHDTYLYGGELTD